MLTGISDWKCEECNKLFPSKVALHRHNNIHTGKANYQVCICTEQWASPLVAVTSIMECCCYSAICAASRSYTRRRSRCTSWLTAGSSLTRARPAGWRSWRGRICEDTSGSTLGRRGISAGCAGRGSPRGTTWWLTGGHMWTRPRPPPRPPCVVRCSGAACVRRGSSDGTCWSDTWRLYTSSDWSDLHHDRGTPWASCSRRRPSWVSTLGI